MRKIIIILAAVTLALQGCAITSGGKYPMAKHMDCAGFDWQGYCLRPSGELDKSIRYLGYKKQIECTRGYYSAHCRWVGATRYIYKGSVLTNKELWLKLTGEDISCGDRYWC